MLRRLVLLATLLGAPAWAQPAPPAVAQAQREINEARQLGWKRQPGAAARAEKALVDAEKALAGQDAEIATVVTDLALFYLGQNNHVRAGELFERALALREKAFGPSDP